MSDDLEKSYAELDALLKEFGVEPPPPPKEDDDEGE